MGASRRGTKLGGRAVCAHGLLRSLSYTLRWRELRTLGSYLFYDDDGDDLPARRLVPRPATRTVAAQVLAPADATAAMEAY
eukprot:scaffold6507_cov215-Prasinococcus_capsulatus_cf.AAC.1